MFYLILLLYTYVNLVGLIILIQTHDYQCEVNYHGEGDNQFPSVISQRITLELPW